MTVKNVLLVLAHPEPRSLNGSLAALAERELTAAGHRVTVSDLYAMKWSAAVDADDFPGHDPSRQLNVMEASRHSWEHSTLPPEVAAEQEKLLAADAVVLQFPLWWFSMPALLKGWVDRVFTYGFGYGTGRAGRRLYGDGTLAGRRAMVAVTIGAGEPSFSARGINGHLPDVLFPLQHGLFHYTGMAALPPFAVFEAAHVDEARFARIAEDYRARLRTLFTTEPIAFRPLAGGDYTRTMELRPGLETPGTSGPALHVRPPAA
ncbi:NAD(P)H-dependent oxidoreductase [Streptomyces sodiiphilus]|uniref:NAD(P)H-dependent oxidoreductase n=1 Tax=Streptomyces sodiiphilus TaxID=226217 RepID=A0ABN2PGX4_9ACTN